jgi:hypothetical protein
MVIAAKTLEPADIVLFNDAGWGRNERKPKTRMGLEDMESLARLHESIRGVQELLLHSAAVEEINRRQQ